MAPNGKRGWEPGQKSSRRKKAKVQHVVSLGHNTNLNTRHVRQFMYLSNLVTKSKTAPQATNNKSEIFEDNGSSHGLYLEWKEKEDLYYLWWYNRSKDLKIKFEILSVIEDATTEVKIKRPIVTFSDGFGDGSEWGDVKTMLDELFSISDDSLDTKADHLIAFTRTGDKFQIRIFKVKSMPTLDDNTMTLDELFPIFVIKPVEIKHKNTKTTFLNMDMFSVSQRTGISISYAGTCLSYACGYYEQYPTTILHEVLYPNMGNFRLSAAKDLTQWEGFNTNLAEYFERYYAFKRTKVPGTGYMDAARNTTEKIYCHLCLPFQMFSRSLILRCRENFDREACFETIDEDKVFFRGNALALLGVNLVKYSAAKAEENMKQVGQLITRKLIQLGLPKADFPMALQKVLHYMENCPLGNLQLITHNVSWMEDVKVVSMVDDLYQDFSTHMTVAMQIDAGKHFLSLHELQNRISRNWLLFDCRTYDIEDEVLKSDAVRLLKYYTKQKYRLQWNTTNMWDAARLNEVLQCFRTIRNDLHHLAEAAERLGIKLTRKQALLIVASEFSDVLAEIQEGVPDAFSNNGLIEDNDRMSLQRFASYFPSDDSVMFSKEERK